MTDTDLADLVERARSGEQKALNELVSTLQHPIYRLALRMTACPDDAADATQEILVKVVTRLGSFRGEAAVATWAHRIAIRHLLDRKKSRVERLVTSFERYGEDLLDGLAAEPDPDPLLAEEVKLGCTLAMLTCLDREQRVAYVLADVFDVSTELGAELCEVAPDAFRQRVSRARRSIEAFVGSYCGLVSESAPCRCDRRVARAVELGRVRRDEPMLAKRALPIAHREMHRLFGAAELLRSHPEQLAPERVARGIRDAIDGLELLS